MKTNAQFVTDASGNRIAVQLSLREYSKILEKLEELEEIGALDDLKKRKTSFEPFSEAIKAIRKANPK